MVKRCAWGTCKSDERYLDPASSVFGGSELVADHIINSMLKISTNTSMFAQSTFRSPRGQRRDIPTHYQLMAVLIHPQGYHPRGRNLPNVIIYRLKESALPVCSRMRRASNAQMWEGKKIMKS
ncbi:uncharacterized protein [Ptychodera flava]|uniref:uncharacterized protein n=1 Tax=Ptychodera flava TaxID=63121 RepID=UPI00396A0314